MSKHKARLLIFGGFLFFIALWTLNWHTLITEHRYYIKGTFMPGFALVCLLLLFKPEYAGKPETRREQLIALSCMIPVLLISLGDWYLLSHYQPPLHPGSFWHELARAFHIIS